MKFNQGDICLINYKLDKYKPYRGKRVKIDTHAYLEPFAIVHDPPVAYYVTVLDTGDKLMIKEDCLTLIEKKPAMELDEWHAGSQSKFR